MRKTRGDPDFLDEMIADREARQPGFAALVAAAIERRRLMRTLAAERERAGVSQTEVAAKMGTSQSAVARLERGELDAKLSTVERFATALGQKVEWKLVRVSARRRGTRAARAKGR